MKKIKWILLFVLYTNVLTAENYKNEKEQVEAINESAYNIKHMKNPSIKVQRLAIEKNADMIEYIKNPSEEIQIWAVQNATSCWLFEKYIKHPTKRVKLAAAITCAEAVKDFKKLDESLQLKMVEYSSKSIKYIQNPTKKVELLAFEDDIDNIEYIKKPSLDMQWKCIKDSIFNIGDIQNPAKEIVEYVLNDSPSYISWIKNQSEEIQLLAIEIDKKSHSNALDLHDMKNPTKKVEWLMVKRYPCDLTSVKNPSKEMQMYVAKENTSCLPQRLSELHPEVLEYVLKYTDAHLFYLEELSEALQIKVLEHREGIFKKFKNPSKKVQLLAIKKNPENILHIKNPSTDVLYEAIKADYKIIEKLNALSEEQQLFVLKVNLDAYNYMSKLQPKAKEFYLKSIGLVDTSGKFVSEVEQKKVLEKSPWSIEFLDNPSEELQLISVAQKANALQYIKEPSKKVKLKAIAQNGWSIKYVKNPTEEMKELAIRKVAGSLKYIKNPSEKLQLLSVAQDCRYIGYIDNPSEQVQYVALRQSSLCVDAIESPSDDVIEAIMKVRPGIVVFMDKASKSLKKKSKELDHENDLMDVKKDGLALERILKYTQKGEIPNDVIYTAIRQNPKAVVYLEDIEEVYIVLVASILGIDKDIFSSKSEKKKLEVLKKYPWAIELMDEVTMSMSLYASEFYAPAIRFFGSFTEKQLIQALNKNPEIVNHLNWNYYRDSNEFIKKAIEINPKPFDQHINQLEYTKKLEAIEWNPKSILYMKKKTKELIVKALSLDGDLINKVYPLSMNGEKNFFSALAFGDIWKDLEDKAHIEREVLEVALKEKGVDLSFLENQTEENQLKAIEKAPWTVRFMHNPSTKVKERAVKLEPSLIILVPNASDAVKTEVLKKDASLMQFIKEIPIEAQRYLVKKNPHYISSFNLPTKEIQLLAVQQDGLALEHILLPDDEVINTARKENSEASKFVFKANNNILKNKIIWLGAFVFLFLVVLRFLLKKRLIEGDTNEK